MRNNGANGMLIANQSAMDAHVKSACDILRRSKCAGALQYIPELTWIMFLRLLDEREEIEEEQAKAVGKPFAKSLKAPYRWHDWAAPISEAPLNEDEAGRKQGWKRLRLHHLGTGALFEFLNKELLPYLKDLKDEPRATTRQKVISEIMSSVNGTRVDTEKNFLDVVDKVHAITSGGIDPTHIFPLSRVYEGLLLKLGAKNNDGGQFFTPREPIRAIVRAIAPRINEKVYDPCCGTGGFLVESYLYMFESLGKKATALELEQLKERTLYGREKEELIYPIALANMVLHGIDQPNLWFGNTLTDQVFYDGLYQSAPELFDVVLTNPPFGGKEGEEAQAKFAYKTRSTQVLFIQHIIDSLKQGGRCGMVIDEGVLFRTNDKAFVKTKIKLLEECNLWCIVSLPSGVFAQAGGGVKTDLLFFTKGEPTEQIWYYDLSDIKVTKKKPLTLDKFDEFFRLLPERADSERSWTETIEQIKAKNYDLKAVNPNRKEVKDERTPAEVLDIIEAKGKEVAEAIARLRELIGNQRAP